MKKVLFILLLAMATFAANATTPDEIFTMFKHMPNASYTHLPKLLIKAGLALGKDDDDDDDAKDIAKKVSSISVLELEDCSKKVKDDFAEAVSKLNTGKYETLVKSNDDDEKVNILLKTSKDTIKEMLIVDIDGDEATLVQIKGKIKRSDIDKMVKFSTK